MKRLLNTLFVMTQGAYLRKEGEAIAVRIDGQTKMRVPIITIRSIVCFGKVLLSPALMGFCAGQNVTISFLTTYGKFLARVQGAQTGNVLLRRTQYRWADDTGKTASICRTIVASKIANCRSVLQRGMRDHEGKIDTRKMAATTKKLKASMDDVIHESDPDKIRGIEGDSAKQYFGIFSELILQEEDDFSFNTRSRRPPLDRVNALLSFVYTLLYHDMRSALEVVGLDPAVGFLHRDRPGRMSLSLDLMEEHRPFFADRLVLSLINRKQIAKDSFRITESGAVLLKDEARKVVVTAYQNRKQEVLIHPFLGDKMHIGVLFQSQAILLARYLRGDIDGYPAFIWK